MSTEPDNPRARLVLLILSLVLVSLPFWFVTFVPVTDLPQHMAQVRLFSSALAHPDGPYVIQWTTPYLTFYALAGAMWAALPPLAAARWTAALVALTWVLGVHLLARADGIDAAKACLASMFAFHWAFYWGFLSFDVGYPLFFLWFVVTTHRRDGPFGVREGLVLAATAALLYFTHALWFAIALVWLAVWEVVRTNPDRRTLWRGIAVSPVVLLAAAWYAGLGRHGFRSEIAWAHFPIERLLPSWWIEALFGAPSGVGLALLLVVALWCGVSAWQHRDGLFGRLDRRYLWCAGTFFVLALVLPTKLQNTVQLGERMAPLAAMALVFALPMPKLRPKLARTLAAVALATMCGSVALVWKAFEQDELAGLQTTLEALPEEPAVIGLDFDRASDYFGHYPTMQMFAYAQVLHGGELNFSFADFEPLPVVFAKGPVHPWTNGLEWHPEKVKASDFGHFDFAIIHGDERAHRTAESTPVLRAVTPEAPWRLYRVLHPGRTSTDH